MNVDDFYLGEIVVESVSYLSTAESTVLQRLRLYERTPKTRIEGRGQVVLWLSRS